MGKHGKRTGDDARYTRRTALRRAGTAVTSLAVLPALHACGDEDEQENETAMWLEEETPDVPQTSLEPFVTPEVSPGANGAAESHLVEMNDQLEFVPETLTLTAGDTVVWRTVGTIPHTSTCDEDEANQPEEHVERPEGAEPWNSGIVGQGEEYSRVFTVPGEYTYFCIPHEGSGMIGYLTVQES